MQPPTYSFCLCRHPALSNQCTIPKRCRQVTVYPLTYCAPCVSLLPPPLCACSTSPISRTHLFDSPTTTYTHTGRSMFPRRTLASPPLRHPLAPFFSVFFFVFVFLARLAGQCLALLFFPFFFFHSSQEAFGEWFLGGRGGDSRQEEEARRDRRRDRQGQRLQDRRRD